MQKKIMDLKIDILNTNEAIKRCEEYFDGDKYNGIYFLNAHCCNIARKNKEYKNAINSNTLVLNDGIGVKLALKVFGIKEKENMNGTDFIPEIINLAIDLNKKIYLLGGQKGVVDKVERKLIEKNPRVNIVGKHDGYFNDDESQNIINEINEKKVDLLIVGMGVPLQEIWLNKNMHKFESVKIGVAGGAILDFLSGNVKRAPMIMRQLKLEWLYRLYLEPNRLWKRYLIGNFEFIYNVFKEKKLQK